MEARYATKQAPPIEIDRMRSVLALLATLFVLMVLQALFLTESFGASQGGALIQLATSRPVWYVAGVPSPPAVEYVYN